MDLRTRPLSPEGLTALATVPKPEAAPPLVVALCRALVDATATGRSAYWLSINGVRETLGVTHEELDYAVKYAVSAGLVRSDEVPARSLTVTFEGIDLAKARR
jgi:RIO-like serine/threonine protein kinase